MFDFLCCLNLLLAQNQIEKNMTMFGILAFGAFMLFLAIDSAVKQKFIPKKGPLRGFLIFLFIASIVAFLVYFNIFIK